MLASSLLVHHLMLTCACMISVRLSDLLTQAKLFAPFLFAMVIVESRVYFCWSPIDFPPAELWEGQSYLNCSRGDLEYIITTDYPLPRPRHRCVYALNLRTLHTGWLFQYRDEQLKAVGCLSDILTIVSQGLPSLQDTPCRPEVRLPTRTPCLGNLAVANNAFLQSQNGLWLLKLRQSRLYRK